MDYDDESFEAIDPSESSREPSPEPHTEPYPGPGPDPIPKPDPENTTEVTEDLYQKVNRQLDILDSEIKTACKSQEHRWTSQIQAVKPKETNDEHIIGIIGATGAGKSALLNAVLNEECLVPTSCMQACTAAPIEVAYNKSSLHAYRAIVEFVSRKSWYREIRALFGDTETLEKEAPKDKLSIAAIALAKLSAVYPDIHRNSLSTLTIDGIINRPGLDFLGTTLEINAASGHELHAKLRKYVESKEKPQVLHDSKQVISSHASRDIEYWPLIRKVRIFVNAEVLKTGCVLVDLPGVADINAARASIAQEYLSKCASLWIVLPIVRAVDDDVGRNLLGDKLKRQLHRDGTLNRVAFICSKADQTFVHELKEKFFSDEEFQARMDKLEADKKKFETLEAEVIKNVAAAEKKKTPQSTIDKINTLQSTYDAYAKLLEMAKAGQKVRPPVLQKGKRKNKTKKSSSQKRPKLGSLMDSLDVQFHAHGGRKEINGLESTGASGERKFSTNFVEQDSTQPEMTITEIEVVMDETGKELSVLQTERTEREEELTFYRGKLEKLLKVQSFLNREEWDACYTARNKSVVGNLKHDFKLGLRDLIRAEMEDDKDKEFDPSAEIIKSIEKLDFPVICTASQSFQHLQGRLKDVNMFGELKDIRKTGIPQLMQYCINIGEQEVVAKRTMSANLVDHLLTSVRLRLLGGEDGVIAVLPAGVKTIPEITDKLIKDLVHTFSETTKKIELEVNNIGKYLKQEAKFGESQVSGIVESWGASPLSEKPGLSHQRYRAVVRRDGIWIERGINWIEELLDPTMRRIDRHWHATFSQAIPGALNDAREACSHLIDDYLKAIREHDQFFEATRENRELFLRQFTGLKSILQHVLDSAGQAIVTDRGQAHLVFDEAVSSALEPIFSELAGDSGRGVFLRIKQKMEKEMNVAKTYMFVDAANEVFDTLQKSFDKSQREMFKALNNFLDPRRQECESLFEGRSLSRPGITVEHQATILATIHQIEELLGIETAAVKVEADSPFNNSGGHMNSNDIQIKREPSLATAEETKTAVPVAIPTGGSVCNNKEESQQTTFGNNDVGGSGDTVDNVVDGQPADDQVG